jgi:hypothetical protein
LFSEFNYTWTFLPIAAVIEDAIFCVHGGISPSLADVNQLKQLQKPKEFLTGVFVDLLWSDPVISHRGFAPSDRGLGQLFNEHKLSEFLDQNGLQLLLRSHECCSGVSSLFPHCLTVFSSSDYAGCGNKAAVVRVSRDLKLTKQTLKILTEDSKRRRRVLFPRWLVEAAEGDKVEPEGIDWPPDRILVDVPVAA